MNAGARGRAIRVTALDHLVLNVADVDRSLRFYRDVLGLAAERVNEWRRGQVSFPSVRVDAATIIDLVQRTRGESNVDHICLVVAPLDWAAVIDAGILDVVEGPVVRSGARGDGRSVYVRDPDGNTVELRWYPQDLDPPPLDGELVRDPAARERAAADFGHVVRTVPEAVLRPGSAADIAAVVRWAAGTGRQVAAQGTRHSVYGRSQVGRGVVVDMSGHNAIHHVGADRIVAGAGATWRDVLTAALRHGRTPPVLPEYLDLTIGGTIAVGGVGGTSWRHGVMSDTVLALEVVTGDGQVRTCSPGERPDLFDAVRAGLGQVGVITRATLRLTAAPGAVRRYRLVYSDLDTMLADQRRLLDERRWDYLHGRAAPGPEGGWTYLVDGAALLPGAAPDDAALLAGLADDRAKATIDTHDYRTYTDRFTPLENTLRGGGRWDSPHPWLFTFVGASRAGAVLAGTLAGLTAGDLGDHGVVSVLPLRTDAVRSPLFRLPAEPVAFAMNLMRIPAPGPASTVAAMVAGNRAVYERVAAAGGTLNPASALPMSARDWQAHFGPVWDRFAAAKRAYDPGHVLTPGYEVFPRGDG
ncbi:FAD-binding protein [Actinomadura sp. ATCC 31491]|uniref:FAD-binding protein n=1 Tax=Actinomadura luzonensis TaxID=2805427 RepID=A0ABT0G0Z0_9ACTN|nr:FAD-binding protein [Actinomadura luzonensis]MCK2218230.1 FAD-binding protein [Actinomadura luzonensis]